MHRPLTTSNIYLIINNETHYQAAFQSTCKLPFQSSSIYVNDDNEMMHT